ncbi:hypothetical protein STTU_2944 [Streptomyces sp. Tu6071]|uniref:hypothetical protein n=1 Tax=unclassified Streptomyces TaxID=2593676 RepID=UPI00020E58F5|nr:hypothetical protein [Streptomyces sp. Tu6071]EGJ75733.1 hypothetical protein STTU_2944 [Streptomyces sp. Tu6071]
MAIGRRRPDPTSEPGHGSGISIGGNNIAPLQNVVGQNISRVYQAASADGTTDVEAVRDLLITFREDLDRNAAGLQHVEALRAMAGTVDGSLTAPAESATTLRGVAQALPALVLGTVVQQSGEALAHAVNGLLS